MVTCSEVTERYLETLGAGFHCESVGQALKVVTPYLYPDNDLIEVFVEDIGNRRVRVTDYGETLRGLFNQGLDVALARKRKEMVRTIAAGTGVEVIQGQLVREGSMDEIGELLFDVIVAARGVSDLILTSRTFEPATFQQEVASAFSNLHVEFEPKATVQGRSGKTYRVDFWLPQVNQYVEALSPNQPGQLQGVVNRAVRVWVDVNSDLQPQNKVSLLNDVDFRWPDPEARLLGSISIVTRWSGREIWLNRMQETGRITSSASALE